MEPLAKSKSIPPPRADAAHDEKIDQTWRLAHVLDHAVISPHDRLHVDLRNSVFYKYMLWILNGGKEPTGFIFSSTEPGLQLDKAENEPSPIRYQNDLFVDTRNRSPSRPRNISPSRYV